MALSCIVVLARVLNLAPNAQHHDANNDVTAQMLSRLSALEARLDVDQHNAKDDVYAQILSRLSAIEARHDVHQPDVNNDVIAQILSRLSTLEARLDVNQHDVKDDVIAQILSRLSAIEARNDVRQHDISNDGSVKMPRLLPTLDSQQHDITPLSNNQQMVSSKVTPIVEESRHIHPHSATLELNTGNNSNADRRQVLA